MYLKNRKCNKIIMHTNHPVEYHVHFENEPAEKSFIPFTWSRYPQSDPILDSVYMEWGTPV